MLKVFLYQWEPYIAIPLLFVLTLAILFSGFNHWPILVADQKTSNCVKLVHAPWLKGDDCTEHLVFLHPASQTLNVDSQSWCGLCLPDLWPRQLCSLWQEGRCVDIAVFQFGVWHPSSVQSKIRVIPKTMFLMCLWCGVQLTDGFWIYGPDPFKSHPITKKSWKESTH